MSEILLRLGQHVLRVKGHALQSLEVFSNKEKGKLVKVVILIKSNSPTFHQYNFKIMSQQESTL